VSVLLSHTPLCSLLCHTHHLRFRFFVDENINKTGVSLYAIFDGHGGIFAAEYCRSNLIMSLYNKLIETMDVVNGKVPAKSASCTENNNDRKEDNKENIEDSQPSLLVQRRKSIKKTLSQEDYDSSTPIDSDLLGHGKLSQQRGPITKETLLNRSNSNRVKKEKEKPKILDAQCYVDKGAVNFGKLITDLVLAADYDLVEKAKKESNVAGTTALIAIIYRNQLIVGNVGDSRGVMCDSKNNAIPLSFDHKPQQTREHKRIKENGGFIEFKGVWRVAGILATSRGLSTLFLLLTILLNLV
jgi:protein phosphatase 1L